MASGAISGKGSNNANDDIIRPITDMSNEEIVDAIRAEQTPAYQARIPSATQAGIRTTLEHLQGNFSFWNSFYNTLMNRIGGTWLNTTEWEDPWKEFNRSAMKYGNTFQEIAVGLIKAHVYDPHSEYLSQDNFGTFKVPVDAVYHQRNYEHWYPATINRAQLNAAFLEENGIGRLVSAIMGAAKTSDELDINLATNSLFAEYARLGGYWRVQVPDVSAAGSTKEQAQTLLREIRSMGNKMMIRPQTQYNAKHWPTVAKRDDLMLIASPDTLAGLDVMAYAEFFQIDRAEIPYRIISVLPEDIHIKGFQAILTTKDFLFRLDNLREVTNQRNAVSMGENFYLHHWATLSVSPFAPAALFWTGPGSKITIIDPKKVVASKPEFEVHIARYTGQTSTPADVTRGGIVQLVSTLTNSADSNPNAYKTSGVTYEIGDTEKQRSQWTSVDKFGMLYVGIDEPNAVIPVHATATYIDPEHPEVPMETSADLEVPVVGDGVLGFNPQLLVSYEADPDQVQIVQGQPTKLNFMGYLTDGRKIDVSNMVLLAVKSGDATISNGRILTANGTDDVVLTTRLMGIPPKDVTYKVTAAGDTQGQNDK